MLQQSFWWINYITCEQTQDKQKFTWALTEKLKNYSLLPVFWGLSSAALTAQIFLLQWDRNVATFEMKQVNSLVCSSSDRSIFQYWIMVLKSKVEIII